MSQRKAKVQRLQSVTIYRGRVNANRPQRRETPARLTHYPFRRVDRGIHDALAIVLQDSLGKQGSLSARALRSAGRVAAPTFLEAVRLLRDCIVSHASRTDIGRRKDSNDTFSDSAARYWSIIDDLCRAINAGDSSIGLPPYNGGLFDPDRTPLLTNIDTVMATVIDALSFELTTDGRKHQLPRPECSAAWIDL